MKLTIHGYGKMGHAVEKIARERGHDVSIFDSRQGSDFDGDVVIDFSNASSLENVVDACCAKKKALVIGTTGWNDRIADVKGKVQQAGIGVVYAANFSPGANIAFALARRAGELFARFPQYATGMEERHHSQKKDAPSGTALRMAAEVKDGSGGKLVPQIAATRAGSEVGLHTLFFDSPDDLVEISHRARNRDGFARGAVIAAEMIRGRNGFFRFDELVMS